MIDFRYYLVSIVSIFLALAVGIVLGAGPLKGDIGAGLTEQLAALRVEKTQLRANLGMAQKDATARDTYSTEVAPAALKGRLAGKTIALVVAPDVDGGLTKNVTAALVEAGAKVGCTVVLTDSWADPSKIILRNTVASPFAALARTPGVVGNPDLLAGTVLARAVLGAADQSTLHPSALASAALSGLSAGALINVTPEPIVPSSSVVFLGGSVTGSSPQDANVRLAAYVRLARTLGAAGSGVVVAAESNTVDATKSANLVAAVRQDSVAVKVISTVDDADLPMGQGTVVLALAQEYLGITGQYGLADDAKAIVPDLTARP